MLSGQKQKGFTIVELLIVIVVIAILAAIVIVAYGGITRSAEESSLKSDLTQAARKLEVYKVDNNEYPAGNAQTAFNTIKYTGTDGVDYSYTADATSYCLDATKNNRTYHITNATGSPQDGSCPGAPMATTMQTFTASHCSSLTTYTGSNEEAVITLTDNRGGTERTYQVAKLADDNCWMLNNLKLGSTTGEIILTPSDTDTNESFTLPQLQGAGTTTDYDTPYAYGPVPGDTGSGTTNYGYLYNWPAVTAGESRTSHPAGAGNAPYSICPANWRLPTGDATGEFAWLNAKMNNPSASSPSTNSGTGFYQNWQNTGPFKGVFSGWYTGTNFSNQGSYGYFWSSSAHPSNGNGAFGAYFFASFVNPGYSVSRGYGFGVRCLLN